MSAELKYDPTNAYMIGNLLTYVQHKWNCDWLQPMWHKGPCDCGLKELIKQLPEGLLTLLIETNDHVRCTVEDMKVQDERERAEKAAQEPTP